LVWAILGAVVAAVSLSRDFVISPTVPGLDPSFIYAFNYAATRPLRWGRDFVSTFGPYGYLLSTMDIGRLVVYKLVFSLLLVSAAAAAAAVYVWREVDLPVKVRVALLALVLYALDIQSIEYQCFGFLVLLLLIGIRSQGRSGVVVFGLAGMVAGLYVLMKFSLGLGAFLSVAAGCLLDRRPRRVAYRSGAALCGGIVSVLLGWHTYRGGLSGIGEYLSTGLDVSRGYSSAMSVTQESLWAGPGSFVVWFLGLGLWVMRERSPRLRLSLGVMAVPLFVAWKHAVVRQDSPHVRILVLFGILALALFLVDATTLGRARRAMPVMVALVIPLLVAWYSLPAWHPPQAEAAERCRDDTLEGRLLQPFTLCGLRNQWALRHFRQYRDRLATVSRDALQVDVLPEPTRTRIASASVDVYPWELAYVPANGLSWSNRPLPASFNVYTPALDALNASFFDSDRRPEYLLWHSRRRGDEPVDSIDERHLFWDEPGTLRAILDRYDLVESTPGLHVLRARGRHRFASMESLGRQTAAWDTWVSVPQVPGIVLAHAVLQPSPVVRVIRTGFRESAMFMWLRFASGEEVRHRFVPENAGGGLWVTPFPNTVGDLVDLLRSGSGRQVVAVRFTTGRSRRFYGPVAVSWSRLVLADGTWSGTSR
jgi:hypothetical protein